ncbi:MAG: HPP family protein [Methylibium sp.]|nr:HPP family protein [Methylibium sp.]
MTWPPLRAWLPARLPVGPTERARAALGAALGLLLTGLLSRWVAAQWPGVAMPWLVAPLGASAVLVFAVPASPLAQPWSVVGGNTISALIGIACAHLIPDPAWAAAIAVGLAIGAMFALRCLHPPGGAMALLTALSGVGSFGFAWFPACFNSVLLVLAGAVYNSATRRPYPHAQLAAPPGPGGDETHRFSDADLDAVLERYGQVIDVSRDDLVALLHAAEAEAYRRHFGATLCADIMTREVVTVSFGTELQDAWALLREHRIKALPVVDRARRVVGIVTLADFLRHADLDIHEGWSARLRSFIRRTPATHSDKPEVVGQIMTRQVRVASEDRPVAELVPLFAQGGHHHIPIVGPEARLVGMLTQSDVVSALSRVS